MNEKNPGVQRALCGYANKMKKAFFMNHLSLSTREQKAVFYGLIVFSLVYAYELTHFNLSIDDEFMAFSHACNFSAIGRWLHTLIRKTLWFQVTVPTGPLLIFGAALALAYVFILRIMSVALWKAGHLVVFAAFVLFPTWMAQMEFVGNLIPVGVGTVCAVLAAWMLLGPLALQGVRWPLWGRMLAAVALTAVAVGAYQSLPLLTLVLVLAGAVRHIAGGGGGWY
ncbi:MAG: glucosyltransferase domain-containing protein, partial [Pseudomonadota bacterium]|nr:glucosyltransferase domain-containing protein [Pseudomonadota bacterium]